MKLTHLFLSTLLGVSGATPVPVLAHSGQRSLAEPPLTLLQDEDFPSARAALNTTYASALEALANRCTKARAYLQRDLCLELLLTVDPEHKSARKTLKYKKDRKTGEWSRKKYKAPRDRDATAATVLTKERAGLLEDYALAVLKLLDTHQADLTAEKIDAETSALLEALPNNARLRTHLGQVRLEKNGETHWVQASTVRALNQRKAQDAAWKKALEEIDEVEESELLASEEMLGVSWKACSQGENYRVLSSSAKSETLALARKLEALTLWMHPLIGTNEPLDPVHVYLVLNEEGADFINAFPDLTNDARKSLFASNGAWLGRADRLGVWNSHGKSRMDQTIRLIISYALLDTYGRADGGWI